MTAPCQSSWPRVSGRAPLIGCVDAAGDRYLRACVDVLRRALGADLVGAYLYSSGVVGDYIPGRSDLDVVAVVRRQLRSDQGIDIAEQICAVAPPFPTRGLDLEVVTLDSAATPAVSPPLELKVLTFVGTPAAAEEHPEGDPRLIMHFACCRDHGMAITGPPASEVFAPVSREMYLAALGRELDAHWMPAHYLVLNACRDLRFLEESVICSKVAGGEWALSRVDDPWLIDAALCWQIRGFGPVMDPVQVEEFLQAVAARLANHRGRPSSTFRDAGALWWRDVRTTTDAVALLRRRPEIRAHVEDPLVSCIHVYEGGAESTVRAINSFIEQDYPRRELVVVAPPDVALSLRARTSPHPPIRFVTQPAGLERASVRDLGCSQAVGDLIALWEPDVWYAPWRLTYQVAALLQSGHTVSGCTATIVWDPALDESWAGRVDTSTWRRFLVGATVCVTRQDWAQYSFAQRRDPDHDHPTLTELPFGIDAPSSGCHVPRDAHFAVLVKPWSFKQGSRQVRYPSGLAAAIIGDAAAAFGTASAASSAVAPAAPSTKVQQAPSVPRVYARPTAPLVSCIMPTFNRRRFIRQAVRNIRRQDYPAVELVVVDDGSEPIADMLTELPRAKYIHVDQRVTIGHKRNVACEAAAGEILIQWDDDDWYAPNRISRQVSDIVLGNADATGIGVNLLLDVRCLQIWSTREREALDPHFGPIESLAGGTIATRRDLWRRVGGYPDASIGEDIGFLQRIADAGGRVVGITNLGSYVYVRHGCNSWRFDFAPEDGPPGWNRNQPPVGMDATDLRFYASLSRPERGGGR